MTKSRTRLSVAYVAKRDGIDYHLAERQLANGLCRRSGRLDRVCSTPTACVDGGQCILDEVSP